MNNSRRSEENMKRKLFLFVAIPILIGICTLIGGQIVKLLWNWLLPNLFGFKQISFWQAIGLLALCRILFGGMGMGGRCHRRADGKWEKLTPEEREKLRDDIRNRWHGKTPPEPKTSL
jgi:hypothetical protein